MDDDEAAPGPAAIAPDELGASTAAGGAAPRRTRMVALVVALLVVSAGGLLAWRATQPRSHFCTLTGASGPKAFSPQEAFDAWYAAGGAQDALRWTTEGQAGKAATVTPPAHDDFEQASETTWEWHYGGKAYVRVDVGPPLEPAGRGVWAVTGVNGCSEG